MAGVGRRLAEAELDPSCIRGAAEPSQNLLVTPPALNNFALQPARALSSIRLQSESHAARRPPVTTQRHRAGLRRRPLTARFGVLWLPRGSTILQPCPRRMREPRPTRGLTDPSVPGATSGRPGGTAGVVESSRAAGCPLAKERSGRSAGAPQPSKAACFRRRPSFSHVLASVLPLRSESQSQS